MLKWNPREELATEYVRMEKSAYAALQLDNGEVDDKGKPTYDDKQWSGQNVTHTQSGRSNEVRWEGEEFWLPSRIATKWASGRTPLIRVLRTRTEDEAKAGVDPGNVKKRRPAPERKGDIQEPLPGEDGYQE